jgi:hypothetical protein
VRVQMLVSLVKGWMLPLCREDCSTCAPAHRLHGCRLRKATLDELDELEDDEDEDLLGKLRSLLTTADADAILTAALHTGRNCIINLHPPRYFTSTERRA